MATFVDYLSYMGKNLNGRKKDGSRGMGQELSSKSCKNMLVKMWGPSFRREQKHSIQLCT